MVAHYVPSTTAIEVGPVIIPILQKGKLRLKELQEFAWGHTADKQQSQGPIAWLRARAMVHHALWCPGWPEGQALSNKRKRAGVQREWAWDGPEARGRLARV